MDAAGLPATDRPDDPRVRTPIERAGAPVALVLHRPTGPLRPDPLATLVEAGGLAIEIARLRVELRRQLAEVEASRARIVAAGNAERRRIERDLHDGAQQRLVSIGLELRHAQHQLGPAGASLDHAVAQLTEAIAELRDLAQGLPPSQLDGGLEPALLELAGRAPLPVAVAATRERFSAGVEAAAYFIACEGLTNAIKHARASGVVLSAERTQRQPRGPRERRRRRRRDRGLGPQRPARPRRRPRRQAADRERAAHRHRARRRSCHADRDRRGPGAAARRARAAVRGLRATPWSPPRATRTG